MTASLTPALILILGAVPVPFLPRPVRSAWMLALPLAGLAYALSLETGVGGRIQVLDYALVTLRVDRLSQVFSFIFFIASFLGNLYALSDRDRVQQVAALIYAGGAIGGVYAGDLITLFVFWELTAVASAFLIWARRTERAYLAGMRYLVVQVLSGMLLLTGLILRARATGSVAFDHLGLADPGTALILVAFGIKCAFPLLHNWLPDSYPEATVGGTVILSAFTTKLAVYALARGYAGTEMLVGIGAAMTVFPIVYALIENDLRRVLAYSLMSQLGFMVVGIGIGTETALNGTAAHAFAHILYKALLFMSMGAVLYRAGTVKATELGGLYRTMPWTAGFCIVGAASISAFPLFGGFVSKSLILAAAADRGHWIAWLVLLVASAGVVPYLGLRVPFFAFFGRDSGKRVPEAPWHMLAAMAITAALSIGVGIWPRPLYDFLPYPVAFDPYSTAHVLTQLQLLLFSALAFTWLVRVGFYPSPVRSVNVDSDVVYRRLVPAMVRGFVATFAPWDRRLRARAAGAAGALVAAIGRESGGAGRLARTVPVGNMALWVVVMLGIYLVLNFI